MTVAEVAEVLKLNQQTVEIGSMPERCPQFRVGRRVRVKRSDFERRVEEGYRAGPGSGTRPTEGSVWDGEVPDSAVPAGR